MKFYKLSMDMEQDNNVVCHCVNKIRQNAFNIGKHYVNAYDEIEFYYDEQEGRIFTDYLANDKGWFVVSQKLQNILQSINTQIQYFPVKVVAKNRGIIIEEYCIANVLRKVDALCLKASDYFETEIPGIGPIYTVSKYGIYAEKTEKSDIFKLTNRQEIPIFVSEKFKYLIEKENVTGICLQEIRTV